MHYTSAPSTGEEFTAKIVSYDRNQSCLVSSLSFHATASRNGSTVTCTTRDTSNQSLSLHIISSESVLHFFAKNCSLHSAEEYNVCYIVSSIVFEIIFFW